MTERETDQVAVEAKPEKRRSAKKAGIVTAVVAAVIVAAAAGFWAWHETPGFCGAICHTPMDEYLVTYEQEPGVEGVDKYGEAVSNTDSMLAVTHRSLMDYACLDCHVPTMSEQIAEGVAWATGDYVFPLEEATLADLTAARGSEGESFCMNESCHNYDREMLIARTDGYERNPHEADQHGELACSECHKAHRASVMFCAKCHDDAEVPEGWVVD